MPNRSPRRLSRSVKFRGRVFRVEQERVRLTNGREVTLDIVRHGGSVVLLAQPSRTEIVLVRQYRHAIRRWIWELPAGSLERGEPPARAARRESEEEIGMTPGRVVRVAAYYPTPGFCDEIMLFYRCEHLKPVTRQVALDLDEQITPRVMTVREARRLADRNAIVDMKTLVGLQLISG